jgi:uncharacterized membrane protein YhaH (DUF805 family)
MLKLTGGYEYRTYWFELFETVRKVLLVGIPSTFPGRGGTAQLFWGLLVCFATFGAYMMYAPFVEDSDDMLSQLAQLQIFLTLLSSLALRATPPSDLVGSMVTFLLFFVPLIGVALETPLFEVLGEVKAKFLGWFADRFTHLKPPPTIMAGSLPMPEKLPARASKKYATPNPAGTLKVHIASASGLKAANGDGTSDPYVIARVGGIEKQTKVIEKTLDPTWGETLEIEVAALEEAIASGLTLTVYDKNTMRFDVNLGEALVSLEELKKKQLKPLKRTAKLSEQGTEQGSITFTIEFVKADVEALNA